MLAARRLLSFLCPLVAACLFVGCANYQLGTDAVPKFATLYVAPVRTDVLLPQARVELTTRVREAFLRDGRVRLVNSAETADAVLELVIAGYQREAVVTRSDDTGLARRFDITLQSRATLRNNRGTEPWFSDRLIEARRGAMTDDGLVPAETQLLPVLGDVLAREAVQAVLDTW